MAVKACEDNGYHVDPEVVEYFTTHRKTHNAGVFDAYTPEMRACRSNHIITGLPDAYGDVYKRQESNSVPSASKTAPFISLIFLSSPSPEPAAPHRLF